MGQNLPRWCASRSAFLTEWSPSGTGTRLASASLETSTVCGSGSPSTLYCAGTTRGSLSASRRSTTTFLKTSSIFWSRVWISWGLPPRGNDMGAPRLLIIDDDEAVRLQLKYALRTEFSLRFAEDPQEALERAEDFGPSVALLHLGLPPDAGRPTEGLQALEQLLEAHR